jgi:hypothetical protein
MRKEREFKKAKFSRVEISSFANTGDSWFKKKGTRNLVAIHLDAVLNKMLLTIKNQNRHLKKLERDELTRPSMLASGYYASLDDEKNIKTKGEKGEYIYTPDNLKKLNKDLSSYEDSFIEKRDEYLDEEIEVDILFIPKEKLPKNMEAEFVEAFLGFIIDPNDWYNEEEIELLEKERESSDKNESEPKPKQLAPVK